MGSNLNGNGDGREPANDENIVRMPTLAERDRARREKEKLERKLSGHEPAINIPPVTSSLLGLIVAIHIIVHYALSPEQAGYIMANFGFTPGNFTADNFSPINIITPITSMFLHGSWYHLIMNAFMLAAFGSGLEKWLGSRRMLTLFFVSGLFGVAAHFLLNMGSEYPLIGASGGLSGFFAAAIVMLNRGQREVGGRVGILPFALIWIGLSIGLGMLGGPDGSMIAWAAHVGGFLGGFVVLKAMRI